MRIVVFFLGIMLWQMWGLAGAGLVGGVYVTFEILRAKHGTD